MKYYILSILAGASFSVLLSQTEPNLKSDYAQTPFDRCMEAYQGSKHVKQCQVLK